MEGLSEILSKQLQSYNLTNVERVDVPHHDGTVQYFKGNLSSYETERHVRIKIVDKSVMDETSSYEVSSKLFEKSGSQNFILRPLFKFEFMVQSSVFLCCVYEGCESFKSLVNRIGVVDSWGTIAPLIGNYLKGLSFLSSYDRKHNRVNSSVVLGLVVSGRRGLLSDFGAEGEGDYRKDFLDLGGYLYNKAHEIEKKTQKPPRELIYLFRHLWAIQSKHECLYFHLYPLNLSKGGKLNFLYEAQRVMFTEAKKAGLCFPFLKTFEDERTLINVHPTPNPQSWKASITQPDLLAQFEDRMGVKIGGVYTDSPSEFLLFIRDARDHPISNSPLAQSNDAFFDAIEQTWPGFVYLVYRVLSAHDLLRFINL